MIRAHRVMRGGGPADLVAELSYDARHRRRLVLPTRQGESVLLDLQEATRLRGGDRVEMEDGRVLEIAAEAEPVRDLRPADAHAMTRLAWHLGNRHTPTAIFEDRLRIRPDHVLEALAERLGARVEALEAPFDPEPGAYHGEGGHHHHGADDGHG